MAARRGGRRGLRHARWWSAETGAVSAEYVAVLVLVAAVIAALVAVALPQRVADTGEVAVDCLFDQVACELPTSTDQPPTGPTPQPGPTHPADLPSLPDPAPLPTPTPDPPSSGGGGLLDRVPSPGDVLGSAGDALGWTRDRLGDLVDGVGALANWTRDRFVEVVGGALDILEELPGLANHVFDAATEELARGARWVDEHMHGTPTPRSDAAAMALWLTVSELNPDAQRYTCGESSSGIPVQCVSGADAIVPEYASAWTLGHFVFCNEDADCAPGSPLVQHELVHVEQFEEYGDAFVALYAKEAALNGTRCDNRFEVPAYEKNRPCPH